MVQVLWFVRNGSALAGVESIVPDICHLVTLGQGADSRKWSVCHLCYEVGGGVSGHGNIHCTALTHDYAIPGIDRCIITQLNPLKLTISPQISNDLLTKIS